MEQADRIEGVILGTAIGDALGLPYEGMSPRRVARYIGAGGLQHAMLLGRGLLSDDTEHTCMVARALMRSRGEPEPFGVHLARELRWWLAALPAGIGWATLRGVVKLWLGVSPGRSGVRSAGNGPAMRAALLGVCARDLAHLRDLVRVCTQVTHTDPRAEQGALVIARLARLAAQEPAVDAEMVDGILADVADGPFRAALQRAKELAAAKAAPEELAREMGYGKGVTGFVVHTVPAALFCWLRYRDDARAPIAAAIALGGDTDTCAAITGALVGAEHGGRGLPQDWISGLRDWPLSVSRMQDLAHALARGDVKPRQAPWLAVLARNLAFMGLIMAHLLRRAFPPW